MADKDNPIVYLTKKMWGFSDGNRKSVIIYIFMFIIANAINFFEPLIVAWLLNTIQQEGITSQSVWKIIWISSLFFIMTLAFWAFHGPARVLERKNAFLVRAKFKQYLIDGTMNLPAAWHTDHHSGDTIDKIEKGTRAMYEYTGRTFEIIETIIRLLGSYFALVYFNLASSYIVLFLVVITITVLLKFDSMLIGQYKEINHAENRTTAQVFDVISNITTVIILRAQKLVSNSIVQKIMHPFKLYNKNIAMNEVKYFFVSLIGTLMMSLVISSYVYQEYKSGNVILIGTVFVLYGYVQRISAIFFRFAYRYGDIVREKTDVQNAEEISNDFKEMKKDNNSIDSKNWNEIKIESLNFSYSTKGQKAQHLDNVSLSFRKGERVALIGESGSGKTTMLKVLRELYTPQNVKLYLDGKELVYGFSQISDHITLIPQDPEIFSTTIMENITLGLEYDITHIIKFTDMANFTDVAQRLPNKFNSLIYERGVNLSGGEKQRLALARGLLAGEDKEIILLDEPTSSVDTKNELEIYKHIFTNFSQKTIISSIHRLHLLPLFDKIYFFKGGKIIASGNFQELLNKSPEFKKSWERYNSSLNQKKPKSAS